MNLTTDEKLWTTWITSCLMIFQVCLKNKALYPLIRGALAFPIDCKPAHISSSETSTHN